MPPHEINPVGNLHGLGVQKMYIDIYTLFSEKMHQQKCKYRVITIFRDVFHISCFYLLFNFWLFSGT
jgi:hypothetical protein